MMEGCSSNFLDRPPLDSISAAVAYLTDAQVMSANAPLYNYAWFNYNDVAAFNLADFRGGDAMSQYSSQDNVWFSTTPGTGANADAWTAFYNVVGQANITITNINTYTGPKVSPAIKQEAIGEARFMRALAYRFLVMYWGAVPIITDNVSLLADPTSVKPNTIQSIWKFVCSEMRQAAEELPETPYAVGRVTKWSAEGMLARFYLSRSGVESSNGQRNQQFLDSAKYYAQDVITKSGKSLLPSYRDLFLAAPTGTNYNNNDESLFELQWVYTPGGAYGYNNSTISQMAPDPTIVNGDGWGGDKGATLWMLSQYEGFTWSATGDTLKGRTLDQRLHESFMLPGFSYPEITRTVNGVDQKPFVMPNNSFGSTFDGSLATDKSSASIKKYIIGQAKDVGGNSGKQNYPNDTYMLRLSELYLIYAEATLGPNAQPTTDPTTLQYFNAVHTRAGLPAYDVSQQGPLTYDKIFQERACEFAMEGTVWFTLVDLYYWNPQKAFDIINTQQYRAMFYIMVDKFPNPTTWSVIKSANPSKTYATANEGNFFLPLPAGEVTQAPNLLDPPVDYYAQ
jgi:hypothetical protein